jgi:uncharacterized protein YjdB
VATVDASGKVHAVAAGEATITATAGDKTATCKVTVKEASTSDAPGVNALNPFEGGGDPLNPVVTD